MKTLNDANLVVLTEPEYANETKIKKVWNEEYKDYDMIVSQSNRGGFIDEKKLSTTTIDDVYKEIVARDDFGIVTLYSVLNNESIKVYIDNTNIGYNVRPFLNGCLMPSLFLSGSAFIISIFQ